MPEQRDSPASAVLCRRLNTSAALPNSTHPLILVTQRIARINE